MKIKSVICVILTMAMLACMAVTFSGVADAVSFSKSYEAEDAVLMANPNPDKPCVAVLDSSTKLQLGSMQYGLPEGYPDVVAVALVNNPSSTEDAIAFNIDVPVSGKYDITFTTADVYKNEKRKNALYINGSFWSYFSSGEDVWADDVVQGVYFSAGENKISIRKAYDSEGNIFVDKIKVDLVSDAVDYYNVEPVLSNPNSNDTTKRLFSYLCDTYGEKIIAGQFASSITSKEFKAIIAETGKTPAMMGFDLMNYTSCYAHYLPTNVQNLKETQNIVKWVNESNGIATVTWHWYAPYQYIKGDKWTTAYSNSSIYTKATSDHPMYLSTKRIMNGDDKEGYDLLVNDIDMIASQLKILQKNNVTVLFRPLHEAAGNETAIPWFWWGQDKDAYIKLWKLVYDRLTDYHGLDNLIWVWNGQSPDWYPGDNYCDIIGWDVYPDNFEYTASSNKFWQATGYPDSHNKIVALSENGTMPSIDQMIANDTIWSYFCTWSGEFVVKNTSAFAETYTSKEELLKLYTSDKTVTLEDLPADLYTAYPIGTTTYTLTKSESDKFNNPYEDITTTDTDTEKPVSRKPGDVNNDGSVDVIDVALIRANIVGTSKLDSSAVLYADMNGDNSIDIIDVVMVRSAIINK